MLRNLFTWIRKKLSVNASVTKPNEPSPPKTQSTKNSAAFRLSDKSLKRLHGVHPDLVRVVKRAIEITDIDFTVLEGIRSLERQKTLYAQGVTKTMNSRHLTGHAVDIAPFVNGAVSWHWPHYYKLAECVKKAAEIENVSVEWGGDWKTFKDGPHWQLPWSRYLSS